MPSYYGALLKRADRDRKADNDEGFRVFDSSSS
jgi:hypothetical protein